MGGTSIGSFDSWWALQGELVGISISVTPKRLGIVNFIVQKVHCKRNLLAYKASKLVS